MRDGPPPHPAAYFITFRTYGTWLPGDDRGWVDRDHNNVEEPMLEPSAGLRRHARYSQAGERVILDIRSRANVHRTISDVCAFKEWELLALAVRTNHLHNVLRAPGKPEPVLNTLKAWCTRRLREAGLVAPDTKLWAQHGSTRYLWDRASIEGACRYVMERQDPVDPRAV